MSEIKVDIGNVSQFMPAIRKMAKGRVLESVNKPGVRARINYELYEDFVDTLPVDTGAFRDSPISADLPSYDRIHIVLRKDGLGVAKSRYANGKIDDTGILFDPYQVSKDGVENHYASKIRNLNLNDRIRRSTARKRAAIARVLIEDMNHEQNR